MYRLMMAAMGAMILWALAGCVGPLETGPSAMVRTDVKAPRVTVDLAEIVTP